MSLNIAQLYRPSTSPVLGPSPIAHDFNKYNDLGSYLAVGWTGSIGVGLWRANQMITDMWQLQTFHLITNAISDLWSIVLLAFQSTPKLHDSSQYSSPLTPHFLAKAMITCFTTNNRMTRCYPRPTPILLGYILPSLTTQNSSAEAIIYNQMSLDTAQSGLPPLLSLVLSHKFVTWLYMLPSQLRTLAGIASDYQISLNTALLGLRPLPIWSFTSSLRFQLTQQIGVLLSRVLCWDYCRWV